MTIKYGVILRQDTEYAHEHITTAASFIALLSLIETWLDNTNEPKTLGIVLDDVQWKFQEYTVPELNQVTVAFSSFAVRNEEHFPQAEMREIIRRCRELILKPEHDEDNVIGFLMYKREIGFVVTTIKSSYDIDKECQDHYPLSYPVFKKETATQ